MPRYTVSRPGIDIAVPDEASARSMAIASLPIPAKITDIDGRDVTREILRPSTFRGKVTVTTQDGDILVMPVEMFMVRGDDGIPGFITADLRMEAKP